MQRSISISASIPLISDRPASLPRNAPGVRLKVANIAWALALIVLGLGPTPVMADDEPYRAVQSYERSLDRRRHKGPWPQQTTPDSIAPHGEYQTYLQQAQGKARGASGFRSANVFARIAAGTWSSIWWAPAIPRPRGGSGSAGAPERGGVRAHGLGPSADLSSLSDELGTFHARIGQRSFAAGIWEPAVSKRCPFQR